MEKIDQKLVLFFLFLIVLSLLVYNIILSNKLEQTSNNYYQTKEIVEKIEMLKKEWENNTLTKARVNKFINSANRVKPTIKNSSKTTKVEIADAPIDLIRNLSSEILISPIVIKHLNITRKNENAVSIILEVSQ